MKKLLLIINPVSGRGMYKTGLGDALRVLHDGGYVPTVRFTTRAGEATEIAAENAHEYDLVCCLGGDGTLSDVINGLMRVDCPPPIGYFPLGTANDVATTLKLPKNDTVSAAQLVADGEPRAWDVGDMGDGYFTYIAAFGAFTDVSYETSQASKQALGHLAYILEGASRISRLPHYLTRVELDDGRVFEGDYIFGSVSNSTSVAGMIKLDEGMVGLDDGIFEVALVRYPDSPSALSTLMSEAAQRKFDGSYITITPARSARFTFAEPVPFTRDGEDGGSYQDVTIRNCKQAVRIITARE